MEIRRTIERPIAEDLAEKMVLVGGPRQVGKTTLARHVLGETAGLYLNFDNREDRRTIKDAAWPADRATIVLDELHKMRGWKSWLKGEHDTHRGRLSFLVTGSARLDVYRKGGDSLQGRYHHYRLHPLSLAEVVHGRPPAFEAGAEPVPSSKGDRGSLMRLLARGGYPEPFLSDSERALRRWQKERIERFFREDVRDLEALRDLSGIEALAELLPGKVASLLSVNSLREDLEASHRAVTHWLDVLDRLYHVFRISPFTGRAARSLRKMPKLYLWDYGLVPDPGARFENLVASHLLKFCHYLEDVDGHRTALHYLRDKDGREVDFLVTLDRKPWFAVEAKLADEPPAPALLRFKERLGIPFAFQVARDGKRDVIKDGVRCVPAERFLAALV